jgi:hypothetical protein
VAQIVAKRNLRSARSADLEFGHSRSEAGTVRRAPARPRLAARVVIVRRAIAAASPVALRKAQRAAPPGAGAGDENLDRLLYVRKSREFLDAFCGAENLVFCALAATAQPEHTPAAYRAFTAFRRTYSSTFAAAGPM